MPTGISKHFKTALYRWRIVFHDLCWVPIAWIGAYWLRANMENIPQVFLDTCLALLPFVFVVQLMVNFAVGLHCGEWRFVSLPDLTKIVKAVIFGTASVAFTAFVITRLSFVPRSIFIFYALLLATGMGGTRLAYRLFKDRHFSSRAGRKVVIIGAGSAGEQLVRDLRRNFPKKYNVIAFLDDDNAKIGRQIHGVPVVASVDVIEDVVDRWGVDLALLAVPSANDEEMQRIVKLCEKTHIEYRTLPGVHELLSGKVSLTDLREVRIEDLLGREPVDLDWHRIKSTLNEKVILISGAGGSIGSELSRQLAAIAPAHVILFEQSEFSLYSIESELVEAFPEIKITPVLGDIVDKIAVQNAFELFRPDIVFHAAAYKHVPLLEGQTREAIKNNVIGTQVIADMAFEYQCETFVLISTDKAVNPSSLMGACKRSAEIYCQMLACESKSKFITVRFGNVLGSAGSVVPRFQRQIRSGGPVTVTHPDMTRYFMTITEATQLILEASVVGSDGRIYVLDMGQPVKIIDLARQLILLSGKQPGNDIAIEFTGLRSGEKLFEELFHSEEDVTDTQHDKLLLAKTRHVDAGKVKKTFTQFQQAVDINDCMQLTNGLKQLVPEYDPVMSETCTEKNNIQSA